MSATFDETWVWHPSFSEQRTDTAGLFVHFRNSLSVSQLPPKELKIQVTADTRYKLYVNKQLVRYGPVKGDKDIWFYDEVDIAPFLRTGINQLAISVLRFFSSTQYSPSFPRLAGGGMRIVVCEDYRSWAGQVNSSELWETAIDPRAILRIDDPEDCFLNIYEHHKQDQRYQMKWQPSKVLRFKNSTGNAPPWRLSPRMIPNSIVKPVMFSKIHKMQSALDLASWESLLLRSRRRHEEEQSLCLPSGSKHEIELGVDFHTTAFIRLRFRRPEHTGSSVRITYSESYEDEPDLYAGIRKKSNRLDTTKLLVGPQDIYHIDSKADAIKLGRYEDEDVYDIFETFHWRTFRLLKLTICVGFSDLFFDGIEADSVNYPLNVKATFQVQQRDAMVDRLWTTSLRTLVNCMHDCYEDCPFYEQMQYAMDTRSTCLFTYCVSGDGRLARQAILQLAYTFQPRIGLIASRAPTNRYQIIPHFSLYWIHMLNDYFIYFKDNGLLKSLMPVVDAILFYFEKMIDTKIQLVRSEYKPGIWNYVDWTADWKPYGVPPLAERTGFCTFTNEIYSCTLQTAASLMKSMGRPGVAEEYSIRASQLNESIREHCFDGQFFTDSLAIAQDSASPNYSQHSQIWAVLCGAVSGAEAQNLMKESIRRTNAGAFVQESISMSFYTMRALSVAGGGVYEDNYHDFWKPWQKQLDLDMTTWVEDIVAQRSDCHAWGCVPLYEYMREVVGVRPAKPGWEAVRFHPRLELYREVEANVPMSMIEGESMGSIVVTWKTLHEENDAMEVSLVVDLKDTGSIPIYIRIPGRLSNIEISKCAVRFKVRDIDSSSTHHATDITLTL